MKFKKFAVVGAIGGLIAAGLGVGLPANAANPIVTTYTASPSTVRSGEAITFTTNGSTDPSADWDFVGCWVYWWAGQQFNNQINGDFNPWQGPIVQENLSGVNLTFQGQGYANQNCVVGGVPATAPTFDTGLLSWTPQLAIDPITLNVGQAITQASFPYSSQALGGATPFDWSSGGAFTEASLTSCAYSVATSGSDLPPGVTLDDAFSPNGVAPSLVLSGTPTTVGTYIACLQLDGDTAGQAFAYVTINVVNALPDTGVSTATAWTIGITGSVLAIVGAALIVIRRRKSS